MPSRIVVCVVNLLLRYTYVSEDTLVENTKMNEVNFLDVVSYRLCEFDEGTRKYTGRTITKTLLNPRKFHFMTTINRALLVLRRNFQKMKSKCNVTTVKL